MQYCNEDFDALMADAAVEPDLEAQVAIYNEAQQMLVDDSPVLFIAGAAASRWSSRGSPT